MNKKQRFYAVFFLTTVLFLAVCGILLFALPQRTYSENENRYLTTLKPPSFSDFLDTSMQKNFTDGANDQFLCRDLWMKFATALQRAVGFQDIGGVYFGKEGYYFERILDSHLSDKRWQNNLQLLEQFAETYHTAVSFLPVPSKGNLLTDLLPANAVLYHANKLYEEIPQTLHRTAFLDVRPVLLEYKNSRQLYFKTDHHWTMDAAYLTYTAWCKVHGTKPASLETFAPDCVRRDFFGTLYSKAPDFCSLPDDFYLPVQVPDAELNIDGRQTDSIYDWQKLDSKDQYGVYFGGNFGRIDIRVKHSTSKKTLLLIKDSFANSIVPFFMKDYQHIIMIDLRYYNKPLSSLMQETAPEETLFLYELSNFAQDINFFKILK
ncbi:MAG: hypothetical protein HFH33_12635 [Eubacterium sp.]|nr:hypothetical protein [Eubacterium sp.]